jgi:rubrerythrin
MMEELTMKKAVELAITTEQLGAAFYSRMEKKFHDQKELEDVFCQLSKDEKTHEAQFKKILEKVPENPNEKEQWEEYQFMRATAISEFFRRDAFKDTDKIDNRDEALGRALAFEKSTLQYYKAMQDILGEEPMLEEIINAERKHVLAIMKVIVTDAKFRGTEYNW